MRLRINKNYNTKFCWFPFFVCFFLLNFTLISLTNCIEKKSLEITFFKDKMPIYTSHIYVSFNPENTQKNFIKKNILIYIDHDSNFKIYEFPFKKIYKGTVNLTDNNELSVEVTLLPEKYNVEVYAFHKTTEVIGYNSLPLDIRKKNHLYVEVPLISYNSAPNNETKELVVCDLLYHNNVIFSEDGNRTLRWGKNVLKINLNNISDIKEAVSLWKEPLREFLEFKYTNNPEEADISFIEGGALNFDGTSGCGNAENFEEFKKTVIHLSPHEFQNCPPRKNIVMHELGHSLGFMGHTKNRKNIMDKSDINWRKLEKLDEESIEFMKKLYSHPNGTNFCEICPCPIFTMFD